MSWRSRLSQSSYGQYLLSVYRTHQERARKGPSGRA